MSILLREVKILDPSSPHHNKTLNVFVKDGVIAKIDKEEHKADRVLDCKGQYLSQGWFDMQANFNDPGLEHKEDIDSGCQLAAASGFTGVATLPNTTPVIQTKSHIEYIKSRSAYHTTDLFPIAAVTIDTKGEDFTEMLDLHEAGAVAFSDGEKPIWHTDILLKSLIYLQKVDGLLINLPEDRMLTRFCTMHEGIVSTNLGLRGMPALAEHISIKRDLDLLKYAGGKIHFSNISSKESIKLIKKAKNAGLNVTCDVSIHHLLHTDEDVVTYDPNYKINPPLRTEKDRKALIKGLEEGVIDLIVSAHTPHDEECKKLEFDKADFGIMGLQTILPGLLSLGSKLDLNIWIEKITTAPRSILKIESATIEEGNSVNLTLFDPKKKWKLDDSTNLSKSRNSTFWGKELTGKVTAVFNGTKSQIF
ncbi:dihydroorotase [Reichenbachiella versicolor]|uniref:dihydroorotase n=1 Tax=Reichenbachiella versicolor TaxID=1821036 RepID=UPI000D6E3869|nr:dihydroorotase [Reichenbachiella versicolor]